jgi:hypothetical protein
VRIFRAVNILAGLALTGTVASAQNGDVPGRDLLTFPLGLVVEGGALPGMLGVGLFNPAAARLPEGATWRLAAGAMSTPADISVSGQAGGVSRGWRDITLTVSMIRAAVDGLLRTDSDPLTTGNDVPYSTQVLSLGAAAARSEYLTLGAALRLRKGQLDFERRTAAALDVGFVAQHLPVLDARLAAATYLGLAQSKGEEPPTLLASADARIAGRDTARAIRAGVSVSSTEGRAREEFYFGSARFDVWEARAGVVQTTAFGATNRRSRFGIGVHYGTYVVGLAREGTPAGLAPSYQFVISTVVR